MNDLSDLEHMRSRPGMYVGDTIDFGLRCIFNELLDNSIDQFLAHRATTVRVSTSGSTLVFIDDGPGLPFDQPGKATDSLAEDYLTQFRRDTPTADGHSPHVHIGGLGLGLPVVTGLTKTCEVTSRRNGVVWRLSFSKGIKAGPPQIVSEPFHGGTSYRLEVDRELFSVDWSEPLIEKQLVLAAHLFPGFRVETPRFQFSSSRGLADLAAELASTGGASHADRVWWFSETIGDLHVQAAIAGTANETEWRAYANGNTCHEGGTHLEAFKHVVAACQMRPSIGLIHVLMSSPRFTGPTRSKLNVPDIIAPIVQSLVPSLKQFASYL